MTRFLPYRFILAGIAILLCSCNAQADKGSKDNAAGNQEKKVPISEAGLKMVPLTITGASDTHKFTVEVAATPQQQAMGLMFRKQLAADQGMIFPFPVERVASFWMKNTLIPLDIIFIRKDGTIESIAAETTPYSLESVRSNEPVAAVLEIAGGRAEQLSINAGDRVEW